MRELPPTSPYAGDDGSAAPALAAALAMDDGDQRLVHVVRALATTRVMVPVVAHLEEREEGAEGEITGEKEASAAMVTLAGPDGRAVIPVFSSMDTLRAWRPNARPIPVEAPRAALAAVSDADGLIVVDPAGPVTVQIPRPAIWALAQQKDWVPAAADPQVASAIEQALAGIDGLVRTEVVAGQRAEVRIVLYLRPGLQREEVADLTNRASQILAGQEFVAERIDSLEMTVKSA